MSTEDGQLWIAYNGEVYNFDVLRTRLRRKGLEFRSGTDTEVILKLFQEEGPDCFGRLNGMFALAIWDNRCQSLFLARDRFGIKPVYYALGSRAFAFASEIKAMWGAGLSCEVKLAALDRYLAFLWVPEPETILEGVHKLPPGHWACVQGSDSRTVVTHRYWQPNLAGSSRPLSEDEAVDAVRSGLTEAVRRQTVADVPVSAFLSGGVDSSAIVALMAKTGNPPRSVHSVGFSHADQQYEGTADDLPYARRVAMSLGLDYDEIILEPNIEQLLPKLIWHLDEPLADPAAIPAFLISRRAATRTKVLLSGMGADEVFGGYRRHLTEGLIGAHKRLPMFLQRGLAGGVAMLPSAGSWPLIEPMRHAKKFLNLTHLSSQDRYIESCVWMNDRSRRRLYSPAVRHAIHDSAVDKYHRMVLSEVMSADAVTRMLYADTHIYLPSHNLNYTDKMSMAASIEVRVPFLDNDLVDLAFDLPVSYKVRGFKGKRVLKRALTGILPSEVISRRKAGFAAPIRSWILRDLKQMVGDLLSPERIARRGFFEPSEVSALLNEQWSTRQDYSYQIWALLTFELWIQTVLERGGAQNPSAA